MAIYESDLDKVAHALDVGDEESVRRYIFARFSSARLAGTYSDALIAQMRADPHAAILFWRATAVQTSEVREPRTYEYHVTLLSSLDAGGALQAVKHALTNAQGPRITNISVTPR